MHPLDRASRTRTLAGEITVRCRRSTAVTQPCTNTAACTRAHRSLRRPGECVCVCMCARGACVRVRVCVCVRAFVCVRVFVCL